MFSVALDPLTREKEAWLRSVMASRRAAAGNVEDWSKEKQEKWEALFGMPIKDVSEIENFPEFDFNFELNGDHKMILYMSSMENGSVDHVILVVQAYLKKFHPKRYFSFRWANTCSKPRTDGFSGGGALITAKKVYLFYPEEDIRNKEKELKLNPKRGFDS
jgi:hypothetical protein